MSRPGLTEQRLLGAMALFWTIPINTNRLLKQLVLRCLRGLLVLPHALQTGRLRTIDSVTPYVLPWAHTAHGSFEDLGPGYYYSHFLSQKAPVFQKQATTILRISGKHQFLPPSDRKNQTLDPGSTP